MNAWRETPVLAGRHATLRALARDDRAAIVAASAYRLDFQLARHGDAT